ADGRTGRRLGLVSHRDAWPDRASEPEWPADDQAARARHRLAPSKRNLPLADVRDDHLRRGALWLANQLGIVACLDPRTGRVLARGRVSQSELVSDVAVDQARRTIIVDDGRAFATITPPGRCWG